MRPSLSGLPRPAMRSCRRVMPRPPAGRRTPTEDAEGARAALPGAASKAPAPAWMSARAAAAALPARALALRPVARAWLRARACWRRVRATGRCAHGGFNIPLQRRPLERGGERYHESLLQTAVEALTSPRSSPDRRPHGCQYRSRRRRTGDARSRVAPLRSSAAPNARRQRPSHPRAEPRQTRARSAHEGA